MNTPQGYGRDVITRVAPWLVNVYAQNQKIRKPGPDPMPRPDPRRGSRQNPVREPPGRAHFIRQPEEQRTTSDYGSREESISTSYSTATRNRLHRLFHRAFQNLAGQHAHRSRDQELRFLNKSRQFYGAASFRDPKSPTINQ